MTDNGERPAIDLSNEVVNVLHELASRRQSTLTPVLRRAIAVEKHLRDEAAAADSDPEPEDPLPPAA